MDNFCFMIKSYDLDFDYCQRLVESINKFNYDKIHTYIVVEGIYEKQFQQLANSEISIICLEEIPEKFVETGFDGISAGYINQEIAKLSFWKLKLVRNYLCLDSDSEFVRTFYLNDFMFDDKTPYSFLTEDRQLQSDSTYYEEFWKVRELKLRKILHEIDFSPKFLETCHNSQVFSSLVLEDFEHLFLMVKNYSIIDILRISPYEFSWYNFWLQKRFPDLIHKREPCFLMIHTEGMELALRIQELDETDISRGYIGLILNSNYSRGFGIIDTADQRNNSLARLISFRDLAQISALRLQLGFKIRVSNRLNHLLRRRSSSE